MQRPIHLSHTFLAEVIDNDCTVVDATMGNGNDTLFLAERAGKVIAFDIQQQALLSTQERLEKHNLTNVTLVLAGHETVDRYVDHIRAAIFNLGYLPSADKSIITKPQTTLLALQKILDRLDIGGRISIMIYYGHEGGNDEKDAVIDMVSQLDQTIFTVMLYKPLNQINTPPFLIMIERLK